MYSNVYQGEFGSIRNLISKNEFQKAYDLLQKISNKCSEWYYLTGLSAMNIGYYDEGEEYINTVMLLINITNIEMITTVIHTITTEENKMI